MALSAKVARFSFNILSRAQCANSIGCIGLQLRFKSGKRSFIMLSRLAPASLTGSPLSLMPDQPAKEVFCIVIYVISCD